LVSPAISASDTPNPASDSINETGHKSEFDASKFILSHIGDSHEWHIYTDKKGHHVSVPLPVILYSRLSGLHVFLSHHLSHGHVYRNFKIMDHGEHTGSIVELNEQEEIIGQPYDFSMTKIVMGMLVAVVFILFLFIRMGRIYKREGVTVPHGINGILEPLVLFIKNQIALPNIGEKKHEKYTPYLLTTFFFIFFNNLFGLIPFFPFGANVTGNIAVTMVLSLITLIVITIGGTREYWKHILATPGVPKWLLPVMIPVEVLGMFTKPFALMIRLFANITAGHIIILSLISLIFIFKSLSIAPVSILLLLFMNALELMVAFLQAYVFTLLSALFIGMAVKEHHH
jgi:F-type H+-transporting ATPase subunit a